MASRPYIQVIPPPPRVDIHWLKELNRTDHRLSMKQMLRIEHIIERLELPCRFIIEVEIASLRIYARNVETNPPHARPIPLLTLRETRVPRGEQYHPRHNTLGRAWLARIAFNGLNEARCTAVGISPGTLRPGSIYPR